MICPVVPDAALYSLSARNSSNSWNPGELVKSVLSLGEPGTDEVEAVWRLIYDKLSIEPTDDVWARLLHKEFASWRPASLVEEWTAQVPMGRKGAAIAWHGDNKAPRTPATQFFSDLAHALTLKDYLTRRQWISIIESLLRLGTASHVLWQCHVNSVCLNMLEDTLVLGQEPPSTSSLQCLLSMEAPFWRYGQRVAPTIREYARKFAVARAGINLVLWHYEAATGDQIPEGALGCVTAIRELACKFYECREQFPVEAYRECLAAALDVDPKVIACKRGITANISEFLGHVLRQRQTSEVGMDSYDQGYYLSKRGNFSSAPWVFSLGPVSTLLLVDCCTHARRGPRTVDDLCRHLRAYGVDVSSSDIMHNDLGRTLRNLNLVLDSPDAEGGMVLVSPFRRQRKEGES